MKQFCLTGLCLALSLSSMSAEEFHVYFGTYTGAKSRGIFVARFNSATGKLSAPELAAEMTNPSFLAVSPDKRHLYAVSEVDRAQGKPAGAVKAFGLNARTGKLTALNQQTSGGTGPCHLAVDATGECALVANYGSGSIAAFPIRADGSLSEAASVIQHSGSSVNRDRQAGPHAHCVVPTPDNRFVLACDLGLDQVLAYRLDAAEAKLAPNNPPFATVAPGSGPRHLTFSPDGKFVYVINEMALTVTGFTFDASTAALHEVQTISTLPAGYAATPGDSGGEIALSANGKFLYASNRGHDSITLFSVDAKSGALTFAQNVSTEGKVPRHFAIDPTGHWLLAENQSSDSVVVFAIAAATGQLKPTGNIISIGSPICAMFVAVK